MLEGRARVFVCVLIECVCVLCFVVCEGGERGGGWEVNNKKI